MMKKQLARWIVCGGMAAFMAGVTALAGDWPMFRGPDGSAVCTEKNLPLNWDAQTGAGIVWKAALPAAWAPWSSPAVAGGKVFLTSSEGNPVKDCSVLCFSVADGKKLWETKVEPGPWKSVDGRGSHAASTPCTDGRNVYVLFGSAVVAGLDGQGKLLWRKELKAHQFDCNIGVSPVLYGDMVLVVADQNGGKSSLLAFDKKTGALKHEEPRRSAFAHSTPIIVKIGGADQLIVSANNAIQGVTPATGKVIWWFNFGGETASPAFCNGMVYSDGGRGGPGVVIRAGGTGDITGSGLVARCRNGSDLSSPVFLAGHIYRTTGNTLTCLKAETGEKAGVKALPGISSWASPFATTDGRVYVASGGKSYVVKASPECEILATNDLGDPNHASPAVSNGRLFIRGQKQLWCIGKK